MKKRARPGWFAAWKVKLSRVSDAVMRSTFELIVFPGQLTRLRAVLIGYAVVLLMSLWLTAGLPGLAALTRGAVTDRDPLIDILQKLASAYTPILVDIGIVIMLGLVFMYRYAVTYRASVKRFQERAFEKLASQVDHPPVVIPFRAGERIWVDLGGSHFGFDAALACTVQVSALSSDRLFHAVQGALDFAKLSLQGVSRDAAGLVLHLGSCAFRDLNIAHYWAFVPLSVESTDETNKRPRCMFDLLSPSQKRWCAALGEVVRGTQATSRLPSFAPNPLGISVLLRVNVRGSIRWLMRRRADSVAADEGMYCAAVAGLIDVYPDFPGQARLEAQALIRQEYADEVEAILAEGMEGALGFHRIEFRPLGLVFPAEFNYQPELYFLAEVQLGTPDCGPPLPAGEPAGLVAAPHVGDVHEIVDILSVRKQIRGRDLVAIEAFGLAH